MKLNDIVMKGQLQEGKISFEAEMLSHGYMAPSNGLLSYRITRITTAKGEVIDASKLNGELFNHYQRVMGQDMMAPNGPMRGYGELVLEKGTYFLKVAQWIG
jgi:hypothetical protein